MSRMVRELALYTGVSLASVRRIMATAPERYKVFRIPKRNGEFRVISQPASEVKLLQRALVDVFLQSLPIHVCATGYRPGLSIKDNASPHADSGPILKMDLRNFFPSIRRADWVTYCRETDCLTDEEDIHLTSYLLFHRPKGQPSLRLAIGAPSSPILSNILMFNFDSAVQGAVSKDKVTYTRYADDMTFSAPRTGHLTGVIKTVAKIIRQIKSPSLDINEEKTTYITKKYHRSVTGLTIANDGRITIGRNNKRNIHALIHRACNKLLDPHELQALCGYLAYINSVEPSFIDVLKEKYGAEVLAEISRFARLHRD